jgi:hypothetical protein
LTHAELVELAARWLRGTRRCALVATERSCFKSNESPDAIGWNPDGLSILVEAKVSVEDFRADQRKKHRRETIGMGIERWYLSEKGVLSLQKFPAGWGLLEVRSGRVFRVYEARPRIASSGEVARIEQPLLIAIVRRAQWAALSGSSTPLEGITVTNEDEANAVPEEDVEAE